MTYLPPRIGIPLEDLEPGPSNTLLRTFSDELQEKTPGDAISRGLAAKVAIDRQRERYPNVLREQWALFLMDARELARSSVPDEEVILLEQSRKLYAAWEKFRKGLPKDQQQDLAGQPPDVRYLFKSVDKASKTWQDKKGRGKSARLKQIFADLCGSCKNHSKMFSVVPSDDKYLCLLTGSLSAVAQASVNHQEIGEAVANSLEQLSQDMAFWNDQIQVHGDLKIMHRYIRELYVVVFEFLTEIFDKWSQSSWKRFVSSFDESTFNKLFTEKHGRMQAIERRMEREANLELHRRMRDMAANQQQLLQHASNTQNEAIQYQNLILGLGASFQRFLEQQTRPGWIEPLEDVLSEPDIHLDKIEHDPAEPLALQDVQSSSSEEPESPSTYFSWNKRDILSELETFTDQLGREMKAIIELTYRATHLQVDSQVQKRLLSWTKDLNFQTLWVQGPHGAVIPSQNCLTAISLTALSRHSDIPCISYFCSLNDGRHSRISSRHALNSMLRSIITQLVLLLPDQIVGSIDLDPARFSALKQDDLNVEQTISLLRDLRTLVPKYLHLVIDSVQLLDDRSNPAYTRDLLLSLGTLCRLDQSPLARKPTNSFVHSENGNADKDSADADHHKDEQLASTMTKLCFMTDGFMDSLAQLAATGIVEKIEYSLEADDPLADEATGFEAH